MKTVVAKFLTIICFSISSTAVFAQDTSARLFYSFESYGDNYIQGIGTGLTFKNKETNLGFQLNTSVNYAEVRALDGYIEDYFAWQVAVKFGIFSNFSFYGEVGIDLSELLFHDFRYDDSDYRHHDDEDDIDTFVGIGAGLKSGPVRIDAFSRFREIDSRYWETESDVFSGIQLSINF